MRAWIHAEENKRRTLQRSDIASALAKSDMFDFLIDIVPREEAASAKRATGQPAPAQGVPGAPTGTAIPPQHANIPQQPGSQHNMPPPQNYALGGHGLAPDQEYPQQPNMYSTPVQPGPGAAYGAPGQQMYNEMEGIYGYPPMQAQQVCENTFLFSVSKTHALTCKQQMYHVQQQRPQDPSVGHDAGHNYSRNDGGEGDADAEGERDYEVG